MILLLCATVAVISWSPPVNAQEPLQYFLFERNGFPVSANVTALVSATADVKNHLTALFDGKTGEAFIFNYETDQGVLISSGVTVKTWYGSSQCIEDYFGSLTDLKELFDFGIREGIRFDPCSITDEISLKITQDLVQLSPEYTSPCRVLGIWMQMSDVISEYSKTMSGFLQIKGDVKTPMRSDFKWHLGMYIGLTHFFKQINGGLPILANKQVCLDFGKILTEPTGIHVLIYLLETLSQHFNLFDILGHCLNSEENILVIIDKLSGEMECGFDGFIHTLVEVVKYNYGCSSLYNVEIEIRNYYYHSRLENINDSYEKTWKLSIQDLALTVQKLNTLNPNCFDGLAKLLNDIFNDCWIENGVDMSKISKIILEMNKYNNVDEVVQSIFTLLGAGNLISG